jgi:hypothetical protein
MGFRSRRSLAKCPGDGDVARTCDPIKLILRRHGQWKPTQQPRQAIRRRVCPWSLDADRRRTRNGRAFAA